MKRHPRRTAEQRISTRIARSNKIISQRAASAAYAEARRKKQAETTPQAILEIAVARGWAR